MPFFRRKPRTATYSQETPETQLRLIRTHMAAQADQLSTLTTLVQGIDQRDRDQIQARAEHRERVERSLSSIRDSSAVEARGKAAGR